MARKFILLLGEGNFSFARVLATSLNDSGNCQDIDLIATDLYKKNANDYDNDQQTDIFIVDELVRDNIRELNSLKVPVWLDVDCTQLEVNQNLERTLSSGKYSTLIVVFNFPHVKNVKMKIHLNRDLLEKTFKSMQALFTKHSHLKATVYMSLCYGQSGLNEVEPEERHRSWNDSWQLTKMAACGNFVLTNVTPFGVDLIDNLMGNSLHFLKSQFEHNLKQYSMMCLSERMHCEKEATEIMKKISFYQPFGYRLRNQAFNNFQGGNVFQFELREDITQRLQLAKDKLIHQLPAFQQFTDSIRKLLKDDWPNSFVSSVTDLALQPTVLIGNVASEEVHSVLKTIGEYLTSVNESARFSIVDRCLVVNEVKCSTLKSEEILLNMKASLSIFWQLKDCRILYSDHIAIMKNPVEGQHPEKIISTGSLYPQVHNRDLSFWVRKSEDFDKCQLDIKLEFPKLTKKLLGANILAVKLKDKYIKSLSERSYCFALQIQSLDYALDRKKVAELLRLLQNEVLACKSMNNSTHCIEFR